MSRCANTISSRTTVSNASGNSGNFSLEGSDGFPSELYEVSIGPLIFLSLLYGTISILSILGNGSVIYIVVNRPRMRSVTNFFLLNLAVADMIIGMFSVPFQFQAALLQRWVLPRILCPLAPFVQTLCVTVSVLTLTVVALDRWSAVVRPLKPRLLTKTRAKIIVSTFWTLALVSSLPMALNLRIIKNGGSNRTYGLSMGTHPNVAGNGTMSMSSLKKLLYHRGEHRCTTRKLAVSASPYNSGSKFDALYSKNGVLYDLTTQPRPLSMNQVEPLAESMPGPARDVCTPVWTSDIKRKSYFIYLSLIQYFFPLSFMICVYSGIGVKMWWRKVPGNAEGSRDAILYQNKIKVIKMLLIVVFMFAFCWLPLQTYNVLSEIISAINEYQYINIIWFCCHWIAMSNSCVNPFVYGLYNNKFRSEFARLYQRALGRKHGFNKGDTTIRSRGHNLSGYSLTEC